MDLDVSYTSPFSDCTLAGSSIDSSNIDIDSSNIDPKTPLPLPYFRRP
jgi:hypothetical protein